MQAVLTLCWELGVLDYRDVFALPNDVVELWLQYMTHRNVARKQPEELSPEATGGLVRAMFGGKGKAARG